MKMWVRVRQGLAAAAVLLGVLLVGLTPGVAFARAGGDANCCAKAIAGSTPTLSANTFKAGPGEHLDAEQDQRRHQGALRVRAVPGHPRDHARRPRDRDGRGGAVIDRLVFEGNHRMKDEQLQGEIQSKRAERCRVRLSRPTPSASSKSTNATAASTLRCTPQIIDRPNNRVDLIFMINEGEKTGVKRLDFVGNKAYSSWRLKEVIKTNVSNWLSFLQTTDVYDPDRIEADRDLIRRFYLKHGYADVQVVSATGEYDPARKGFVITFTIEEGPQYHFGAIDIQSNVRAVDANSLRSILLTHKGDVYNGEAVEKTVENLTIEMARRGYPFGAVRPRGDRNAETRTRRRCLRGGRGHARLHRTHQYPRQHAHPRLRDPARDGYQ